MHFGTLHAGQNQIRLYCIRLYILYFSVGDFVCSGGEKRLREGESTNLTCEVMYSGEQPSLGWFRDDQELDSNDNSRFVDWVPLASKELVLNATDDLDGKRFICRMEIADRKAECNRVLNITCKLQPMEIKCMC